jgi:hypothetical protein
LEKLGFGWVGDKMGNWGFGWPAVGGHGGERPAVVFGGGGGGGWWWVWVVLDLGRRRTEEREGRGLCTAAGKMGERGGKCDLKAGHEGPKTEYVRTYISTFDRTRAGACCVLSHAFELT